MNIMWCLIAVWAGIAVPAHSRDADDGLASRNIILPQRRVIRPADRMARQASLLPAAEARRLYRRIVARRKDPVLLDMGESLSGTGTLGTDPKTAELVEEIMRLSRDFGIMSAAAFFADDGSAGLVGRVMQESRDGLDAISLQENAVAKKGGLTLNKYNIQMDRRGRAVSFSNTAQIAQNGYFNRNGVWMESTVLSVPDAGRSVKTVQVGTPEYAAVADRLVKTNRQGLLALDGSVMLLLDGETMLIQNSFP